MAFPFDERHVQPHTADRSADGTPSLNQLYLQVIVPADGTDVVYRIAARSAVGRFMTTRGRFRIRARRTIDAGCALSSFDTRT
jgi:hypothetical protein